MPCRIRIERSLCMWEVIAAGRTAGSCWRRAGCCAAVLRLAVLIAPCGSDRNISISRCPDRSHRWHGSFSRRRSRRVFGVLLRSWQRIRSLPAASGCGWPWKPFELPINGSLWMQRHPLLVTGRPSAGAADALLLGGAQPSMGIERLTVMELLVTTAHGSRRSRTAAAGSRTRSSGCGVDGTTLQGRTLALFQGLQLDLAQGEASSRSGSSGQVSSPLVLWIQPGPAPSVNGCSPRRLAITPQNGTARQWCTPGSRRGSGNWCALMQQQFLWRGRCPLCACRPG